MKKDIVELTIQYLPNKHPKMPWRVFVGIKDMDGYAAETEKQLHVNIGMFKSHIEHHNLVVVVVKYKG